MKSAVKKRAVVKKKKKSATKIKSILSLKEKLARHNYCRNCGFTGLISSFTKKSLQDAIGEDVVCPSDAGCGNGGIINASEIGEFASNRIKKPLF